jgi:hypothetical protein
MRDAELVQRTLCESHGYTYVASELDSKVGFAISTQGKIPLNGLRHSPRGDTNGWFIWCGEELSQDIDFFVPMHARHLWDQCPEAIPFLGLPPGSRFLAANGYVDIWFDETLLT